MTAGVYRIRNRITGAVYIGSAFDLRRRIKAQVAGLNAGRHENSRLRNAWAALGQAGFAFSILETTEDDDDVLVEAEARWMRAMQAAGIALYNVRSAEIGRRYGSQSFSLYRNQRRRAAARAQPAEGA